MICPFPFLQDRGSPLLVYNCITALSDFGHEIDLLCFPLGRDPGIANVRVHRVPRFTSHIPIGLSWSKPIYDVLLLIKAAFFRLTRRYDLVHGQHIEGTLIGMLVRGRLPLYYTIHSLLSEEMKITRVAGAQAFHRVFKFFEKIAYRAADKIFPVSPSFIEVVGQFTDRNKCVFIPDIGPETVTDPEITQQVCAQFPEKVRFIYSGNLTVYQGIDLLIQAFKGIDAYLLIIGGDAESIPRYQALARELGVDNVHFLGRKRAEEVPSYLAAADVLVSPRLEGSNIPSKLFTYIAMKKPILLTDIPAHRQLEPEAFLYCKAEPGDLADKLRKMLDASVRCDYQKKTAAITPRYTRQAYKQRLAEVY